MKHIYLLCLLCLFFFSSLKAQMLINDTIRYGNEWIRYNQPYVKIPVAQDGVYRVSYDALSAAGFPLNTATAAQIQLWHFGEQIPIYISTAGSLSNPGFIEFYGKKNRGELDRFLYKNGEADILNPEYSLFTDTAAYYLTITPAPENALHYQNEITDLTNAPAKEEWFFGEVSTPTFNNFLPITEGDVNQSIFELGEGSGARQDAINKPYEINLKPVYRYQGQTAVPPDTFHIRLAGIGANTHTIQVRINDVVVDTSIRSPINLMWDRKFGYTSSAFQSNVNVKIVDITGRFGIAFIKLLYPRTFNFEGKNQYYFKINGNGTKKYLEIENFNTQGGAVFLYDLTGHQRIEANVENGKVRVQLDAFTGEKEFYLSNTTLGVNVLNSNQLSSINFPNLPQDKGNYIIISSRKLRRDAAGVDQVQQYADYRASADGGSYKPVIVDVEDLYEQFAYGVQRHPLAIRNFGHYIKENWNPRFVLILGKGQEFDKIRTYTAAIDAGFFVPTFGTPGSDNLLLASNESQVPVIPIGRIAAKTPADITLYLKKLWDYENPPQDAESRAWRKQVIHLGGGKEDWEQNRIEPDMDNMKKILAENFYGANVHTYYKRSNDARQRLESDEINRLLNEGVGIITFFGHGGFDVIDIDIGKAETYNNYQKYPVMFVLGCNAGNIHIATRSYSENFVLQPNRAGIAFMGSSSEGFINDLGPFQKTYYDLLGNAMYGKSIGEITQATIKQHNGNLSKSFRMLLQQFTLHGDPALKINADDAPDYIPDANVQFDPAQVSVREDSFDIKFKVLNIGKNTPDSLSYKISRRLPDGTTRTFPNGKIKAPAYESEVLSYRLQVEDSSASAAGFNEFSITLDPDDKIRELPSEAENNNELGNLTGSSAIKLYIFDQGIVPVEPQNYAIVNTDTFKLRASTANTFETDQTYLFDIDTTQSFDSPLFQRMLLPANTGGVLEWQPKITALESTVYYWRVAVDSLVEGTYNWMNSSFTYLKGSPLGWRQGHFQQLQENSFQDMALPDSTRRLNFKENTTNVNFTIFKYPLNNYNSTISIPYATINNTNNLYVGRMGTGGVIISVFDGTSGDAWRNDTIAPYKGLYDSVIGENWAPKGGFYCFPYSTTTADTRAKAIHFLKDIIPDGSYVLLYTIQHKDPGVDYQPEQWAADSLQNGGVNLFKLLEDEGAMQIRRTATEGAKPYAFLYRKGGDKQILFEELANSAEDTIRGNYSIPGFKTEGSLTSRRIGPARKWARLQQQLKTDEYDQYTVKLYGIQADEKTQDLLLENVTVADTTLEWIDSLKYPYLELQLIAHDTVNRTPVQFGYWQVLYEGVPEAALNPLAHFSMFKDTLQQGDSLRVSVAISNLSAYDMDSLLVYYATMSETNQVKEHSVRLKPLLKLKQDTLILTLPTNELVGKQQLAIEVNPNKDKPDQPELYHFNNIGFLNFYVQGDVRNPLVDVTFDGMRILNGDIVSAKPQIVVALQDENLYLPLIDTSTVELSLRYPDDTERRIPYSDLRFEPGKIDSKGSKATLYYEAEFTQDGTYTLSVKGRDVSGNETGKIAYEVKFKVITKAMISNVFNYPNPFTTSTQFVYTLTGIEPPAQYKIQIMSVSGRIVRELTELDLGPLRIGTHRTELAWDGRDQYGDRMANGVYLYRVIAKDATGKDYEKYDDGNDTDRFFKKNIGKLVILR